MKQHDGPASSVLLVRVHPRSAKSRHSWDEAGVLHIWVTAPAVDGAANRAVQQYLSTALAIGRSGVQIQRGETSRSKWLRVDLPEATVCERLQKPAK